MQELLQRSQLLLNQNRHDLAEDETRRLLTQDPACARGHALLAQCLLNRKAYSDALYESAEATRLDPADAYNHYVEGTILLATNRSEQALDSANLAVSMEPFEPAFHGLVAQIQLNRRKWKDALEAAERGLAADPENVTCNNLRAMALVNLGRRAEAADAMGDTLSLNPENAYSHANQGWTLLHQRKPKEALIHFKEALRLDPNLAWARSGIVEALKAHNFIYRWMLAYFLFMSRLSRRAQWGILLGGYFGCQLVRSIAQQNPSIQPLTTPLLIAYVVFAVLTWLSYPLFNLLLRLSRFGRLVLTPEQTIAANFVGSTLAVCLISIVIALTTHMMWFIDVAILSGVLTLPVAGFFGTPRGWPRLLMAGVVVALIAVAGTHLWRMYDLGGFHGQISMDDWNSRELITTFGFGILGSSILANALNGVRIKKGKQR